METVTLSTDRLTLTLSAPGCLYKGSRFDWTTQVRQLTFDGQPVLTSEHSPAPDPAVSGWGLAGEFGISTPIGYQDCPVGQSFPKVGIGFLRRPDDEPYRFNRAYEIEPATFGVRSEGPGAVLITAAQSAQRGYGWFLKRHWSVRGTELTLTTTLANTGTKPLATEEYSHNFFGLEGHPMGPDWSLTLPRPLDKASLVEWVDPEGLLRLADTALHWNQTPTRDFFLSDRTSPVPTTWTLRHRPTGIRIQETLDRSACALNLWGRGHVVSPELYCALEVAPGTSTAWTRRWSFGKGD